MNHALAFAAAAVALGFTSVAVAVDVVNEDPDTHEVTVIDSNETMTFELLGGQSLLDICEKCSLQIGEGEAVPIEDDQVAVIKQGKIEIRAKTQ